MFKKLIITLGITALAAGSADAASLYFTGNPTTDTLRNNFSLSHQIDGVNIGDTVTVFNKKNQGGLAVRNANSVTFEYLGSEAGFFNRFRYDGDTLFQNKNFRRNSASSNGDTATFDSVDTFSNDSFIDLLNFSFWTSGTTNYNNKRARNRNKDTITNGEVHDDFAIAFTSILNDSVIAFLGDGTGDKDYDDLAVRISVTGYEPVPDISPVPLPGALPMFLSALAGLGYMRYRKNAKA